MSERPSWFAYRAPRRRLPTSQLRAYVDIVLSNLAANAPESPKIQEAKQAVEKATREFENGECDRVSLFLTIKGIEYSVAGALGFDSRELRWLVTTDLRQTPATESEIQEVCRCFFGDPSDEPKPVEPQKLAKLTHVAIGYWSRYADMLLKASTREKFIAAALCVSLFGYFSRMFMAGIHSTILSHSEGLFQWFAGTEAITFFSLGCAGAIVSMALSSEIAVSASRPLDGLYAFWSTVPRLLVGGTAGMLAVLLTGVIAPMLKLPSGEEGASMIEVLKCLLAFTGGFTDRIFFKKLVDTTWRVSGLTTAASDPQPKAG